jgi:hypothetical protein
MAGNPVLIAIAKHSRASAAVEAHKGPDDVPADLVDAETAAILAAVREGR